VSENLKTRVLAAAAAAHSPTRAVVTRRNRLIGLGGAVSGLGAFLLFALLVSNGELVRLGGEVTPRHYVERPVWLVVTTVGGALAIAAAALWLALWRRRRSMIERSRRQLLYGSAVIPLALLAWKVSCSLASGYAMVAWPERIGLRCLALSVLVGVGPLLAFLLMYRSAPLRPALNGAAMGVAAGGCAWIAVDLWCPVASLPHLLLGHVAPLYILVASGALLGQRLLALRRW
jgi:hypothetical protein